MPTSPSRCATRTRWRPSRPNWPEPERPEGELKLRESGRPVLSSTHFGTTREDTMGHWRLVAGSGLLVALALSWPGAATAQVRAEQPPNLELDPSRFEFSLAASFGRPGGYVRVGHNGEPGSRVRLNDDLNIGLSEAVDGAVAFHLTPRDAVRFTFLYYFLRGRGLFDRTVSYNDEEFKAPGSPGHISIDADFYRVGLAYER